MNGARIKIAFKLPEDLSRTLASNIDQHVDAPAVGHANANFVEARARGRLTDFVHERHHGFAAFETESLLADELGLQECLKGFSLVQLVQNPQLLVARRFGKPAFHTFANPTPLMWILNMHVFHADSSAVGITQDAENLA